MTYDEARQWLLENASAGDRSLLAEADVGVARIAGRRSEMLGPNALKKWSKADLLWRVIFLQCLSKAQSIRLGE